jgi:hypothetical protein
MAFGLHDVRCQTSGEISLQESSEARHVDSLIGADGRLIGSLTRDDLELLPS